MRTPSVGVTRGARAGEDRAGRLAYRPQGPPRDPGRTSTTTSTALRRCCFEIMTAVQVRGARAVSRCAGRPVAPAAARLDALIGDHVSATRADPVGDRAHALRLGSLAPAPASRCSRPARLPPPPPAGSMRDRGRRRRGSLRREQRPKLSASPCSARSTGFIVVPRRLSRRAHELRPAAAPLTLVGWR